MVYCRPAAAAAIRFSVTIVAIVMFVVLAVSAADMTPAQSARHSTPSSAPPGSGSLVSAAQVARYHPKSRQPPEIEAILKQLTPGGDAFPDEREAAELAARLADLSTRLRGHPLRTADLAASFLAPEFKGARLATTDEASVDNSPQLEIFRARTLPTDLTLDRAAFGTEFAALLGDFASIETAEFLITAIEVQREPAWQARTTVRFDLAGPAKHGWRAERLGTWKLTWRRAAEPAAAPTSTLAADWRISEWTATESVRSRTNAPAFTDITEAALGHNASFREQLRPDLDGWLRRLDATFGAGGMGHHGVSVGDVDGDGLDDLFVSQPAGLPSRLFHNNGDGTFTDMTETAGLALLDGTSQALFADVDNDGDQDLILITRTEPLLFLNDGTGHFTRQPNAFHFKQRPQGTLTSAAMADFDRDGFVDLYLCVYAYVIGASEDKAGPPTPYHDAQHGPPNVLLRNDGHGHFVDVTEDVGLDQHNDRFSFAAAWADYDEDGWPDLLVSNDFGRKNLYHNDGVVNGRVHFTDVSDRAGVEDYGAGMSAAFVDYDNDGHLDIYTGNMWSAAGQRITASTSFKPDAPTDTRARYRRHARGNSLFHNNGNGTFTDVTLDAHAELGRWAWSSDALDFDNDGFADLFIVNGMFTRHDDEPSVDVDSLFWRQVVASSPLTRQAGTSYDDGWRATNRLLMANGAQAQHERDVLLHNNGHGGFDDVSGSVGLDLDHDGRSFAVLDLDDDGAPDLVVMGARSSPQVHIFHNEIAAGHSSVAIRLIGHQSNRDAIGARVTVETDRLRVTRMVTAGSGFLSQHSKQLLCGLGQSTRILNVTIAWPSGLVQTLSHVPINQRVTVEEGIDALHADPFRPTLSHSNNLRPAVESGATPGGNTTSATRRAVWLYHPFPAPDFTLRDLDGQEHSLSAMAGHPLLIYFWATSAPESRGTLEALSKHREALMKSGATVFAVELPTESDATAAEAQEAKPRAAAQRLASPQDHTATQRPSAPHYAGAARALGLPVMLATEEMAGTYNVVHRYLFDRREDLPLPTAFLVDAAGEIVKVYSGSIAPADVIADIPTIDADAATRLARALPFPGVFVSAPADRSYFQYGLELSEQGYDVPALAAFERVVRSDPSAIAFYNLGTLDLRLGRTSAARTAFEQALAANPEYAAAHTTLGVLLAQQGDAPAAIAHFRRALDGKPDDADAMNNLGYVLFQTGQREEALALYQHALRLQPNFPEALNNIGIFYGQQGDLAQSESYFKQAITLRPTYGEATNNLALVLAARGDPTTAIALLERLLNATPTFAPAYLTLSRLYLTTGQQPEAVRTLERLLERNPTHPQALEMLKHLRPTP